MLNALLNIEIAANNLICPITNNQLSSFLCGQFLVSLSQKKKKINSSSFQNGKKPNFSKTINEIQWCIS